MVDTIIVKDLHVQAVIGVNANERNIKQNIIITLKLYKDLSICGSSDLVGHTISYSTLSKSVCAYVESSHHYTLEALATGVARTCCLGFGVERVKVLVEKPGAVKLAKWPGVKIERTLEYFKKNASLEIPSALQSIPATPTGSGGANIVYISIGSNLGDRFKNITDAIQSLGLFSVVQTTSFMYETDPAYFTEQPKFLNCCCRISTALDPQQLLAKLKTIEKDMKREESFRNAPRPIDLDILYYNKIVLKTENLEIPHKLMWERDFVLVPLSDIAPNFIHPTLHITTNQMKINLGSNLTIRKVMRINQTLWDWKKKTFIMGILNVTPDSFSDGGRYNDMENAIAQVTKLIADGSDIIDIGGQSTYPGAVQIGADEEINRVVPIIKKIREHHPTIPLSIDTYHAKVARAALDAGANVINDVTGAIRDPAIIEVAREYRVPIIINHDRPTPQFLQQQHLQKMAAETGNPADLSVIEKQPDIIKLVGDYFNERVQTLVASGIHLWQIILDPGLGFAKTYDQSIDLIRRGSELISNGFPLLIGPSRKGFIGATLAKCEGSTLVPDAKSDRRLWGTAACCCISAGWGVNIIRIHDVSEIKDTILIADTIYR
ncbi:dihydro-6-hydroxymethylpterin pyrophosphokinase [Heterostelium album PN500]|uniref:Dihydro-6-hydroxymethylpterin pyrophosphokinase n=1 Tax=Heterostelium pallidum (strain ATCC 26659 / Pp 5 / PN500) TaxID=670386 RepID=D3AZP5_HETP5|nr:dihydro-6-hydroxymethylpterin pyrophosphokinase [Heterostelium album PN500]EFA85424.1 dihydro-6-hydroxymethylpterin pyrophosphokinase [Heterostelium album PN500]|eukprot:XP_020437533.1 dihydro-6-hydroxymethylpterin pyrophosphokinase [Heterostelium album PN500]